MFPGSVHPSGEAVEFDVDGDPARIEGADLRRAVGGLAMLVLMIRLWPRESGNRQECAMALAAVLFRAGFDDRTVNLFLRVIAVAAKDEEVKSRVEAAGYTRARLEADLPTYGWPKFASLFGEAVSAAVRDWLDEPRATLEAEPVARKSFETLLAEASTLHADSAPEEINRVVLDLKAAKLIAIAEGRVLSEIKDSTGVPVGDLRRALRHGTSSNGTSEDLASRVARETLRRHYAEGQHLIRTGRNFWHYANAHWSHCEDEQVKKRVVEVAQAIVDPAEDRVMTVADQAMKAVSVLQVADGDPLKLADEPGPVINVRNGELWLDEKGVPAHRSHRADSYLTYRLDVVYDPAATCPRYDVALEGIFAKASDPVAMIRHFNEFVGYAIQPRRDIPAFFIMRGEGENGKTKLLETVRRLMGPAAVLSAPIGGLEQNRFATAGLAGRLMLLDEDVTTGTRIPDGLLKKISERKPMTGERKFGGQFEFVSVALPVMLCNNYPTLSDLSHGLMRRAYVIPFDRKFTNADRDPALFDHIWAHELPGVLNRALEGLQRLRARGQFDVPADCERARQEWLAQANPLISFIDERCQKDPEAKTKLSELYREFRLWAKESGIYSIPHRNLLKRNLENLGYRVRKVHGRPEVVGLSASRMPF